MLLYILYLINLFNIFIYNNPQKKVINIKVIFHRTKKYHFFGIYSILLIFCIIKGLFSNANI